MLRLLLHTWSGCGGLLNGLAVADVNRCRWGEPPYCAWSRCSSINDTACSSAAVLLPPLGAALHAMLVAAETSTTRLAVPAGGVAAPRRLEYCTGRRWRFSSASRGDRQVLGEAARHVPARAGRTAVEHTAPLQSIAAASDLHERVEARASRAGAGAGCK